jgi:hypothetical protein
MFKPKPGELILEIHIPKDGLKQKLTRLARWIIWGIPVAAIVYCLIFGGR